MLSRVAPSFLEPGRLPAGLAVDGKRRGVALLTLAPVVRGAAIAA